MKLTDKAVKAAKPQDKTYRIFDGEGLYLEVSTTGAKYWRMKCKFNGREDRLAFGVYPKVSLSEARQKRTEAQNALKDGRNPRYISKKSEDASFEAVAMKWYEARKGAWDERYQASILYRLQRYIFPYTRGMMIDKMLAEDVLRIITPLNNTPVLAKRILRYVNSIFSFAIITMGQMKYSPAIGLHVVIKSKPETHNPHLTIKELPEFLKCMDAYAGNPITKKAMEFLLLTMTRTSEVRFGKPSEVDFDKAIWEIPAERMKMRRPHIVPLSRQALAILKETADEKYLFPSTVKRGRPISENTILYAIYEMGYKGRLTGHGFRATASTILNERGYNTLAIERQLAHVDQNKVRGAYNHAEYLNERRVILQDWADLLDALRNSPAST